MKFETLKGESLKKKIIIGGAVVIVIALALIISTSLAKYKVTESIKIVEGTINYTPFDYRVEGIFYGDGTNYTESNTLPTDGYTFNSTKSYCTKNGEVLPNVILSYDMSTQTFTLANYNVKAIKCYLYFDEQPGITILATLNGTASTTFPTKSGSYTPNSVTCTNNATAKFDYVDWAVEVDNVEKTTCTVNFESNKNQSFATYLKNKVCSSTPTSDSAAKDCLVNEGKVEIPDYTNTTTVTNYGTTSQYSASSYSSTSGTTVTNAFSYSSNQWTTQSSNMTSGTYYHLQITIPEDGYYQLCYTMSSGNSSNRLYVYSGSTQIKINGSSYLSASTSSTKTGCVDLGKRTSSNTLRIVQRAYSSSSYPIATINFHLEKATSSDVDTGYRYEGKSPNNYVLFNDELWRIIGVFTTQTSAGASEDLVKLIRDDTLDALAWNGSNTNDWSAATLQTQLNNGYLNATDTTCNGSSTIVTKTCKFSEIGLKSTARGMVESIVWNLGGASSVSTAATVYAAERGTTVYDGRPTTWTGKVALMYLSDYGYAVLASSCSRDTSLGSYNTRACAGNNWLYKDGYQWTLMPDSSERNYVFYVGHNSYVTDGVTDGHGARPSIYLKSSIQILGGLGTRDIPYIIK